MNKGVVDRIKKLLGLAKSSNVHEAGLAMKRAYELMKQHNIAIADVTDKEENEIRFVWSPQVKGKKHDWDHLLATQLARVFLCELVIPKHADGSYMDDYIVIGKETNIAIFKEMYKYAYNFVCMRREEFFDFNLIGNRSGHEFEQLKKSFECGIVSGMVSQLDDIQHQREVKTKKKEKDNQCFALVLKTTAQENIEARDNMFKEKLGDYENTKEQIGAGGFLSGFEEGQNADFDPKKLNKGV